MPPMPHDFLWFLPFLLLLLLLLFSNSASTLASGMLGRFFDLFIISKCSACYFYYEISFVQTSNSCL
ncbi:hypothetical protein RchiOBHm_Chr4g0434151 [Rosa chinensis]|uniref:Secreted protein n=1 Tax=Rosa chinensis TaxID=74649 RepID=A0A2P6R1E8_ROSCH|nr:hypothetical protein RchiOBHm_Chr4g0434151 [Rosa chinensis]